MSPVAIRWQTPPQGGHLPANIEADLEHKEDGHVVLRFWLEGSRVVAREFSSEDELKTFLNGSWAQDADTIDLFSAAKRTLDLVVDSNGSKLVIDPRINAGALAVPAVGLPGDPLGVAKLTKALNGQRWARVPELLEAGIKVLEKQGEKLSRAQLFRLNKVVRQVRDAPRYRMPGYIQVRIDDRLEDIEPLIAKLSADSKVKGYWDRPVVSPTILRKFTEAQEQQLLATSKKDVEIAAYDSFDPNKPMVILVHGATVSGYKMAHMAEEYEKDGFQVLVVFYQDTENRPQHNARLLAEEINKLSRYYRKNAPLNIVGHSAGGLVSQGMVNYLHDPNWLGEGNTKIPRHFGRIWLRTIDTPYQDIKTGAWPRLPAKLALRWRIEAPGPGIADFIDSSDDFLSKLFSVKRVNVDFQNYNANPKAPHDSVRTLEELNQEQRRALLVFLRDGVAAEDANVAAVGRSIKADSRFSKLATQLKGVDNTDKLLELCDNLMLRVKGEHSGVIMDKDGPSSLVRHLVNTTPR